MCMYMAGTTRAAHTTHVEEALVGTGARGSARTAVHGNASKVLGKQELTAW